MRSRIIALGSLMLIATMLVAGCAPVATTPQVVVQTQVVTQVQTQVVTQVQTQVVEQQVPVTTTPAPTAQAQSKDPNTFVVAEYGDIDNLDPALDYEVVGQEVLQNVYETLVFYNKDKPNDFVPMLATKWDTSSDGKVYTFTVRSGVKFSDGTTLKPSDIAYSLQRGMLAGGTISPQWLMVQPLLGAKYVDIADLIDTSLEDTPDKLKAADPAKLLAACHAVTSAVTADDTAGTVTFHLAQPWGPFVATLAQPWGAALSKNWAMANKLWDGNCNDWQNYYGPTTDTDPITAKAMGTGPYKLDHWTKGQEVGLTRNDNYWNTNSPLWPGAPTGPAKIGTVLIKYVSEWGTRYSMLQAGDADDAMVDPTNYTQADGLVGEKCTYDGSSANLYNCQTTGSGPLRVITGLPWISRTDVFFNFSINVPQQGGNQFVGSGKLDGNGIPPDFFNDVNIRKAFNYCFDWDTYVSQALYGEAQQATSIFLPGEPGYDPNAPHYSFDLNKCTDAFKASTLKSPDGKSLWDTGFRFEVGYNTGNLVRQTIAQDPVAGPEPGQPQVRPGIRGLALAGVPGRAAGQDPAVVHQRLAGGHPRSERLDRALRDRGGRLLRPPEPAQDFQRPVDPAGEPGRGGDGPGRPVRHLQAVQPAILRRRPGYPGRGPDSAPLPAALGARLRLQSDLRPQLLLYDVEAIAPADPL